jgi:hypothetical protein
MKVSRRKLAQILTVGAVTATAQAPPRPDADGDLQSARAELRGSTQAISRVPLPMAVEPAFHFKA